MKTFALVALLLSSVALQGNGQQPSDDHLAVAEVTAAVAAKPNTGFVQIVDMGFTTPSFCKAQMPSEAVFTPEGWINARASGVKAQFLKFDPTPEDTLRALTIVSKGCANGTAGGPVCDSITRVVLMSDASGSNLVEASMSRPILATWQNGFGATASCSNLLSKFPMSDVLKARNEKGEIIVATFNGSTRLKTYTIKTKHMKQLGL